MSNQGVCVYVVSVCVCVYGRELSPGAACTSGPDQRPAKPTQSALLSDGALCLAVWLQRPLLADCIQGPGAVLVGEA